MLTAVVWRSQLSVEGAQVTYVQGGTTFGSTAAVTCINPDHNAIPTSVVTCEGDGQWSVDTIQCLPAVCAPIEIEPEAGEVVCDTEYILPGTSCWLKCSTNYLHFGAASVLCLESGSWQGDQMICTQAFVVRCGCHELRCLLAVPHPCFAFVRGVAVCLCGCVCACLAVCLCVCASVRLCVWASLRQLQAHNPAPYDVAASTCSSSDGYIAGFSEPLVTMQLQTLMATVGTSLWLGLQKIDNQWVWESGDLATNIAVHPDVQSPSDIGQPADPTATRGFWDYTWNGRVLWIRPAPPTDVHRFYCVGAWAMSRLQCKRAPACGVDC